MGDKSTTNNTVRLLLSSTLLLAHLPSPSKQARPPLKLTDLPLELLEAIFKDVWSDAVLKEPPFAVLISLWRRLWWTRLEIKTFAQLTGLVEALRATPERALLVRTLEFGPWALDKECRIKAEGEEPGFVVAKPLGALLSCLPELTTLDISWADWVSKVVHDRDFLDRLPHLADLHISGAFAALPCQLFRRDSRRDTDHYGRHYDFERPANQDEPQSSLETISSLLVRGYKGSWELRRLARRLPSLTHLLFDIPRKCTTTFHLVLQELANPSLLTHLTFHASCWELENKLSYLLPLLSGLVFLKIRNAPFHDLPSPLFLAFRQSRIEHLVLPGTDIKADEVIRFVDGADRVPTLRLLGLGGKTADRHNPTDVDYDREYDSWHWKRGLAAEDCNVDTNTLTASWKLPEWGEGMEGRAEEVVDTARRNGIRVEGSILEGIEGDRAFREEEEKLARRLSGLEM
jgi:hypothetical protein